MEQIGPTADIPESSWRQVSRATPWFRLTSWAWALLAFIVAGALNNRDELRDVGDLIRTVTALVLGIVALGLVIVGAISLLVAWIVWRHIRFALTPSGVYFRSGVFKKNQSSMPWSRVHAVDVRQPMPARLFGFGIVVVKSAGASDEPVTIGYLRRAECEALRTTILATARGDAAGSRGAVLEHGVAAPGHEAAAPDRGETLAGAPGHGAAAPEPAIHHLRTGRLLGATLLDPGNLWALISSGLLALAMLAAGQQLFAIIIAVLGALVPLYRFVDRNGDTTVRFDGENLDISSGLISARRSATIPLTSIHGVEVRQPNLWRPFGWWRVKLIRADAVGSDEAAEALTSAELPIADVEEVLRVLGVVVRDLGVDNPAAFLREAFVGTGAMAGFRPNPRASRLLDPIGWQRSGVAVTRRAFVARAGWWWSRSVRMVQLAHVQSAHVNQGPVNRALGLASVSCGVVGLSVSVVAKHMSATNAVEVLRELREATGALG